MPRCCTPTQVQFNNATVTSITYDQVMRDKYGLQPRVHVYYYDPVDGSYYSSTFFTHVTFDGSTINVDHGGPNTGIISIT